MVSNLDLVKKSAIDIEKNLKKGQIDKIGRIMHNHWEIKKKRDQKVSNRKIDNIYNFALKNGALGGKLIGAGGGGFLMFVTNKKKKLEKKMRKFNLEKLNFEFDFDGTSAV